MSRPLRLVSFNILEGLQPVPPALADNRLMDRARVDLACGVVAALAPDILVLNEALFCRQFAARTVDYAGLFGFPYQVAALYDEAWGNAILSRHPIKSSQEMRIYNRGGLSARIATGEGELTVASYHPHPARRPKQKARDFTRLVAGVEGPLLVCGDFNCISPEDGVDRAQLVTAFRNFSPDPEWSVSQFIESGKLVFASLAQRGLTDAVPPAGRRYSMPTDLINLDKRSGIRIDHILANAHVEIAGGEVVHSADTNRASDHHPVMVDFHIRKA